METPLYGLMAEFKEPENVLTAARSAYSFGYRSIDAYSPFPIDGLAEIFNQEVSVINWIAFFSGGLGLITGLLLQYYSSAIIYPMNIGGRPLNSWIAFVPVCFELIILFAALGSVFSMFFINRLPLPYHPVFNASEFTLATKNRFFIVIEKSDPLFDQQSTRLFLESLNAEKIIEVYQ